MLLDPPSFLTLLTENSPKDTSKLSIYHRYLFFKRVAYKHNEFMGGLEQAAVLLRDVLMEGVWKIGVLQESPEALPTGGSHDEEITGEDFDNAVLSECFLWHAFYDMVQKSWYEIDWRVVEKENRSTLSDGTTLETPKDVMGEFIAGRVLAHCEDFKTDWSLLADSIVKQAKSADCSWAQQAVKGFRESQEKEGQWSATNFDPVCFFV